MRRPDAPGDGLDADLIAGRAGTRLAWDNLPVQVRASIEAHLGAPVVSAESQPAGFSPALAARLVLSTGKRFFIKAVGPDEVSGAPGAHDSYLREARVAAALPSSAPAPRFVSSWLAAGWVVLQFEDISGRHPQYPWQRSELNRVLEAISLLAHELTPSPIEAPPAASTLGATTHWSQLLINPTAIDNLPGLDPWVKDNLEPLAELESAFEKAANGTTLVHGDIRADNILLTPDRAMFVDWPHAAIGAPWLDLLYFLPSVTMQGGPAPDDLFWQHPVAQGAPLDAVLAALSHLAGFFVHGATQPAPPGIPALRRFQLAQGIEATAWLRQILESRL